MICDCCQGKVYEHNYWTGIHPCGKTVQYCSESCARKFNEIYIKENCDACDHKQGLEILYTESDHG